jgi:glycosyltransferase involved in cell wall biosynthesis
MFDFLNDLSGTNRKSRKTTKQTLEYHVDSVGEGRINGWAWSPKEPHARLVIEILAGQTVLGRVTADGLRADLKQAGKGDGAHAFSFTIPDSIQDGQAHALSLRVQGKPKPFHRLPPTKFNRFVEFHIDHAAAQYMTGWAWQPGRPDSPLAIELCDGEEVLGETRADRFRDDLKSAGKANGRCMFTLAIPAALFDGKPHILSLRAKGENRAFHVFPEKTYGELHQDFDEFSLARISGALWSPQLPGTSIEFLVSINGKPVHEADTDEFHRVEWSATPEGLWDHISAAAKDHEGELELALHANGRPIRSDSFRIGMDQADEFAVLFDTLSCDRLSGLILRRSTTTGPLELRVDDGNPLPFACDAQGAFRVELAPLRLADGPRMLSIATGSDDGEGARIPLNYNRFEAELDVEDGVIGGALTDRWAEGREIGIEVLIDDHPVALEIARQPADSDEPIRRFRAPISQRWRDGQPHSVRFRMIGDETLFPARPVLFEAGTPETSALCTVEWLDGDRLSGWIVLPWSPEAIANVKLLRDDATLMTARADAFHPVPAAESFLPSDRGFDFDLSAMPDGPYTLQFEVDGVYSTSRSFVKASRKPFHLQDAGHGRAGTCFVLPDPAGDLQDREDARALLFAAASMARAGAAPLTIVIAKSAGGTAATGPDIRPVVTDLIGKVGAAALTAATFVTLPAPPLPSTATGVQAAPYGLDIWLRANAFEKLVATSRSGVAAYCVSSRRQGLLPHPTAVVGLVDSFAVVDKLGGEHFLDEPPLLFSEALEREQLAGADLLIAANSLVAARADEVVKRISAQIEILPATLPKASFDPALRVADDRTWLVFAGPLQVASGLIVACDALDRLARRADIDGSGIGVVFTGPEDRIRGGHATAYLRARARKWPFQLRLHADLTWDSFGAVLAGYAPTGIAVTMPPLHGSVWPALARQAGLADADLGGMRRPDNATDLADALQAALSGARDDRTAAAIDIGQRLLSLRPAADVTIEDDWSEPPLVSVCISHFNRPTLLRQTLASLAANDYPNFEVVVLDDGSALPGMHEELERAVAEIVPEKGRIASQRNSYLGAARNAAAREARGDLIIFMDDDNLACPDMISAFVGVHQSTGAGIVTSRFGQFNSTDRIDPSHDIPDSIGAPLHPDATAGVISNCFGDANMLITREALEAVGGFTEDFGRGHEDWELLARASISGIRQELMTRACFWYRIAANSMLRNRETEVVDFQRNIRAYSQAPATDLYRVAQLAQGLMHRWDRKPEPLHAPARPGLDIARRLAFGRVAVIMRTKDRPLLLKRAIDSVIGQSFSDWVLVVINDGGDPEPVRSLLDARQKALAGRVALINNPAPTGMENASNAGITNSASEFVVIHDDDDSWDPRFLERCVDHLDASSPEVGGVVAHATVVVEEIRGTEVIERDHFPFKAMEAIDLARLSVENQFPPISFLFRRAVIDAVGRFDGRLPVLGDWDFHLRVAKRFEIDVVREPLAFYHHRVQGTGGDYGNTVVAGQDRHRQQRSLFVNRHVRDAVGPQGRGGSGFSDGEMLFLGELQRDLTSRIQEVKDHMGWIETMLKDRIGPNG